MDKQELEQIKKIKEEQKAKAKPFKTLSRPEKDKLLETIAKLLRLME